MVLDKRRCLLCQSRDKPLFRIPSKDAERAVIWMQAMGKEILMKEYSFTYISNNGVVCKTHFEDWCFTSSLRSKLSKWAVPCQLEPSTRNTILSKSNSVTTATGPRDVYQEPESSTATEKSSINEGIYDSWANDTSSSSDSINSDIPCDTPWEDNNSTSEIMSDTASIKEKEELLKELKRLLMLPQSKVSVSRLTTVLKNIKDPNEVKSCLTTMALAISAEKL